MTMNLWTLSIWSCQDYWSTWPVKLLFVSVVSVAAGVCGAAAADVVMVMVMVMVIVYCEMVVGRGWPAWHLAGIGIGIGIGTAHGGGGRQVAAMPVGISMGGFRPLPPKQFPRVCPSNIRCLVSK